MYYNIIHNTHLTMSILKSIKDVVSKIESTDEPLSDNDAKTLLLKHDDIIGDVQKIIELISSDDYIKAFTKLTMQVNESIDSSVTESFKKKCRDVLDSTPQATTCTDIYTVKLQGKNKRSMPRARDDEKV